jgi:prefoldin subunit 5
MLNKKIISININTDSNNSSNSIFRKDTIAQELQKLTSTTQKITASIDNLKKLIESSHNTNAISNNSSNSVFSEGTTTQELQKLTSTTQKITASIDNLEKLIEYLNSNN